MKTESELNYDILNTTMKIQERFPELSKYFGETPLTMSDTGKAEVTRKNLKDYYDLLQGLLKSYARNHTSIKLIPTDFTHWLKRLNKRYIRP